MQQPSLFTTGRVLKDATISRHKGNPASMDANKRVNKTLDRAKVLEVIQRRGVTFSKEIAREMDRPLNAISCRISELKAMDLIQETGEREEGCALLCLK